MFEIIGFERINFTAKDTGEVFNGYNLHLKGEELTDKDSLGNCVVCKYFNLSDIEGNLKVGAFCEFKVSYSYKGTPKVIGCRIC